MRQLMAQNNLPVEPTILDGGLAVDDRGQVAFVNGFGFEGVKRFYMVANHRQGFVRAWHGHKKEAKYVLVVKGAAKVAALKIDDWDKPKVTTQDIKQFVLSEKNPKVLFIPAGYANGFMSLTDDAQLIFFSTSTLEESMGDDIRFEARKWDIWSVEER
jgi:dTDP-4-dehydrorhamnose 3,5-epimerase-like enzyme